MQFIELAQNRYTTKTYDKDQKIPKQTIEALAQILRLSPSSINSQPWKFIFVEDEQLKSKLAAASYFNEQKINEASHLVVFAAIDDLEAFEKQIKDSLPEGSVKYYQTYLKPQPETTIKNWIKQQVYLSLGFFLSAAASLGVDSSPMEGIQAEKYREILGLQHHQPLFAVALGYRSKTDKNQPTITPKSRLAPQLTIEMR